MYDKNIILSEIEKIKSNNTIKQISSIPTDYISKYYNDDYIINIFKVHDKFRFEINKHLIDLGKLSVISKSLFYKFNNIEEFKTKNKDKLLIYCPRSIGEYCPICSFESALNSISRIKLMETYDGNDIKRGIIILCNNILESFSKIPNYYLPSIIINFNNNFSKLLFLSCNYNDIKKISEELSNKLENNNMSINDVDNFSIIVNSSDNILQVNIIDINLSNREIANKISNLKNDIENYNIEEDNIKYLISGNEIDKIDRIQTIFDKIADEFSENLLELLNKS